MPCKLLHLVVGKLSNTQLNFNHCWLIWLYAFVMSVQRFPWRWALHQQRGWDRLLGSLGGWKQHGLSRFGCRKSLGLWWVGHSLFLCMNELRKQSSALVEPPFLAVKFFYFSVEMSNHLLRAMTISLLMSGCGLNRNRHRKAASSLVWSLDCKIKGNWIYGTFKGSTGLKWLPKKNIVLSQSDFQGIKCCG